MNACPLATTRRLLPIVLACSASTTFGAATLLSRFEFDGDTTNEVASAPDGVFREGNDATTAPASTPTFGPGVDGTPGGAILFDGVDDWVDASNTAFPNDTGAFFNGAVTMWVKKTQPLPQDTTNTGTVTLVGVTDGPAPGQFPFTAYQLQSNAAGSIQTYLRSTDGDERKFRHQESSVPGPQFPKTWGDGTWRHIGMVWATDDFGSVFSRVYYDGLPVATFVTNGALTDNFSLVSPWQNVMAIGANNQRNVIQTHYDGLIDDLRFYEHDFTDQELDADPFILSIFNEKTVAEPLDGDFNLDGMVDAADYTVWRDNLGGAFTPSDYTDWVTNYGATQGGTSVPEPASALLVAAAALGVAPRRR